MFFAIVPNVTKFYVCNLQIFVISLSVCSWQAFPAWSNVCGQFGLIHRHYTSMEMLAIDKHSSLLRKSLNYDRKKFYSTGPGARTSKLFYSYLMTIRN